MDELLAKLAAVEDSRAREVNEKHGDDHSVNLGKLRAIAERPKTQQELTHAQLKALQVSLMLAIPPHGHLGVATLRDEALRRTDFRSTTKP
ncbi:hypothetical protein [Arthrobacter sp. MA-N2]|uniref:hypothetical protein n=1 Tax=Arthrobacter sp. MA-N2 TaxID=1101188 RepID=UPI000488C92B